jgi:hypothetical protein
MGKGFVQAVNQAMAGQVARRQEFVKEGRKACYYETEDGLNCHLESASPLRDLKPQLVTYVRILSREGHHYLQHVSTVTAQELQPFCQNIVYSESPAPVFVRSEDKLLF